MALVDPRLLEMLRTPIQPPIDTNLRDLDFEKTSILDKTGIDVSEKVRLYNQALLRYNDMAKMSATKPTPVVVMTERETPATTDIMGEVVTTLPKALHGSTVHGSGNNKHRRRHNSLSSHIIDDVTAIVSSMSGWRRTMGHSKFMAALLLCEE